MTDPDHSLRRKFLPLPRLQVFATSLLLVALAVAIHSRSLEGQFLSWDDEQYLTSNLRIQHLSWSNIAWFFTHPYFNSYTPLAFLSHALDWHFWGSDPHGHHWHNLLLHGLNCAALFWLGVFLLAYRQNGLAPPRQKLAEIRAWRNPLLIGAAAAALLFAVHPLRVESVAWVSDRKDLLAAFLGLTSCLAYFRGTFDRTDHVGWTWILTSVLLFALVLLSKFLLVFLPLALLIVEIIFLYPDTWRGRARQLVLWKTPFLIPALGVGLVAVSAVGIDPLGLRVLDISLVDRLVFPSATPWFYIQKLLVPANLSPVYQMRVTGLIWLSYIPVVLITVLACLLWRKRRPGMLGAWLVYLVLLSPTFLFLSPLLQHTADRHSYFPTMSIFLLAGGGIALLWQRTIAEKGGQILRWTLAALVLIIAAWHSYLTLRQTRVWENSVSLWIQAVTVSPELPIAYLNLGNAVAAAGNMDDAISLYRRATVLEGSYGPAWTNMGAVYQLQGKLTEAADCFRRSITTCPEYFEAYLNLGEIEEGKNDNREAEKLYREAASKNPGSAKPWVHLGDLHRRQGELDSSQANFGRALAIDPYFAPAHYGNALLLKAEGKPVEARISLLEAARLGHTEARKELDRSR